MLFAGLTASAAVDLLSLLQPEKSSAKKATGLKDKPTFSVADLVAVDPAAQSQAMSACRAPEESSSSSPNVPSPDTLLSAQGQAQASQRKKHSISVLLDLLQSSQDGTVRKSDFEAAAGESNRSSKLFDKIDQNHDSTVNVAELSAFLDSYRRASEAGTQGRARALAVVA